MDFRERELDCPACGSADTKLFVHPDSEEVVHVDGMYLATCKTCNHVFSLDQRGAELLSAALPVGTTLHIATLCPNCDYNLKMLRIGDACPECGDVIPRLVQRLAVEKRSDTRGRRVAAAIFLFAIIFFFFAGPTLFPGRGAALLLIAVAVYFLTICGFNIRDYWADKQRPSDQSERLIEFPTGSVVASLMIVLIMLLFLFGLL